MKPLLLFLLLSLVACKKAPKAKDPLAGISENQIAILAQKSLSEYSLSYEDRIASARISDDKTEILLFLKGEIVDRKEAILKYDGFRRYSGDIGQGGRYTVPISIDLEPELNHPE